MEKLARGKARKLSQTFFCSVSLPTAVVTDKLNLGANPALVLLWWIFHITLLRLDHVNPLILGSSSPSSNEITLLGLYAGPDLIQAFYVWVLSHLFYQSRY